MRIKGGFGWDHLEFIHGAHGGHGSSEFKRNLNGIYTDGLGLPVGKKSLEEIFYEMLLRKKSV